MIFGVEEAGHLLRRAAFGGGADQAAALARRGLATAVGSLVDFPAAPEPADPYPEPDAKGRVPLPLAQEWWLRRMIASPHPLREAMTLFWHNHFATADYKVGSPLLMLRQNDLFRRNALGSFRQMLIEVTRDPAMLIWLDGTTSHKRAPNENYGREMMERFTLGPGHYTEDDVHAIAKALTGYHTNRLGDVRWVPRDHDNSVKTLLGRTGRFGPEQAIDIVLSQPAHGPFLVGRLWEFFIGPSPSPADLAPLVATYVGGGLRLRPVVRQLLSSPAFYDPQRRMGLVRNPAEEVVGAMRALKVPMTRPGPVVWLMNVMGMELFNPPNVGGWPGGLSSPAWMNAGTLVGRFHFAAWLSGAAKPRQPRPLQPGRWARRLGLTTTPSTGAALSEYASAKRSSARGLVQLLLSAPESQLK